MRSKKPLILAWLLVCAAASAAGAQSLFVDGTVFASIEQRAHAETRGESSSVAGGEGTVAGGGASIGAWLTPHLSVRLEVSFPAGLESSEEQDYGIIVPVTFPRGAPWIIRTERFERTRTYSTLLAYHTDRRGRVQLGYLGGAAFFAVERRQTVSADFPVIALPPGLSIIPDLSSESSLTDYGVAVEVGLDVDVSLASRFSVVPQLRVIGVDNGLSLRPGVAVRASW